MMSSTSSIASDDYIFEYKLDSDFNSHYNHYTHYTHYNDYNHYKSGFDKISNHSYSIGVSQPTFQNREYYPSNITVTLNNKKQETWFEYIKRQFGRLFGCFSVKIYSEVPDLSSNVDI